MNTSADVGGVSTQDDGCDVGGSGVDTNCAGSYFKPYRPEYV